MFKRFLAAFLGSMAAIWVSIIAMGVLSFMFLIMIIGASAENEGPAEGSILRIDLSGVIADRHNSPTFSDMLIGNVEDSQSFETILEAIRRASEDKNIKGICLDCGGASIGLALSEELMAALREFRDSGKWVYAYADSYTQTDYYIASVANKIYLNPVGQVDVRGLATQTPYFKNALDKLGIQMQIVKVGSFKSAVEPFILDGPSEPSTLQTRVFLDDIWANISGAIASNRKVKAATVNMWADSLVATWSADQVKENKLVSALEYRRSFENILRKLTGTDKDDAVPYISPEDYLANNAGNVFDAIKGHVADGRHVAILYATGDIVDDGTEGIVASQLVPEIIDLADDDDVAGVVLRVNSGGGSAFASEQIWEALQYLKSKDKPLYVSMADYAASGGYYISCGADRIYADANTLTGSIGIFGMIPCLKGLASDHLGVNFVTTGTNPNAAFGSMMEPLTPAQHAALQRNVDDGYALFTNRVAEGRSLPIDSVLSIAEGRVWDGRKALEIGLVDEIGGLTKAVADITEKVSLKTTDVVSYPRIELSPLEKILLSSGSMEAPAATLSKIGVDGLTPEEARQSVILLRKVSTMSPVQARMQPIRVY